MSTKHLPGDDNDISHIMSHLGDAARARSVYVNAICTEVLAYPATVHTFHGAAAAIDPLAPYVVVQLGLSAADSSEMESAYLKDETMVNGVRMCDVYRVITDHPTRRTVPWLEAERVEAWRNERFFLVPSPEGDVKLMFAPSSATVNKYPDSVDELTDYTRHLVTVVPKSAKVQVTVSVLVTDDTAMEGHYTEHDLWRDVPVHCHDNADHPSVATTDASVRANVGMVSTDESIY